MKTDHKDGMGERTGQGPAAVGHSRNCSPAGSRSEGAGNGWADRRHGKAPSFPGGVSWVRALTPLFRVDLKAHRLSRSVADLCPKNRRMFRTS